MSDELGLNSDYDKKQSEFETLVTKNTDSPLEKTIQEERLSLDKLRKTPYRPLEHLLEIEKSIREQAGLNNEIKLITNLGTYSIRQPKGIQFCPLLDYEHSNCNSKKDHDGNCFETKTPGCRDGRIYLALKKYIQNEGFLLVVSSYISKAIDLFLPKK